MAPVPGRKRIYVIKIIFELADARIFDQKAWPHSRALSWCTRSARLIWQIHFNRKNKHTPTAMSQIIFNYDAIFAQKSFLFIFISFLLFIFRLLSDMCWTHSQQSACRIRRYVVPTPYRGIECLLYDEHKHTTRISTWVLDSSPSYNNNNNILHFIKCDL